MNIAEICCANDLSITAAEKALGALQSKGLVTGFVPGDLNAEILSAAKSAKYTADINAAGECEHKQPMWGCCGFCNRTSVDE